MAKQTLDVSNERHIECLKETTLSVPFIDDLKEIPRLKELLTKKRAIKDEVILITHRVNVTIVGIHMEKKGDLGEFTIPYCAMDMDIPVILGRPFLATSRALMDSKKHGITFQINNESMTFKAGRGHEISTTARE
ncbi:hypothetical protein HAX54_050544 [Datura stramonium]|uniref:Reverse transcriptase domain-containing protein n=1 Tax=Datura stramonium TaxID=4076 RepID=A0ABS8SY74_DATST|nr:hypothetical protein [Datura stramonium]